MALKLGELLVQEELISAAQLEEALKYQVIFGGRLGTNLIEMGFLAEGEIARVLSKKLGVPFAPTEALMNIPPQVIQAVPREIVKKYRVIPLRLENRRLTLAMADPTDFQATEEIAFRTGFVIKPVITPELRLVLALEKYYQIERDLRYIQAGVRKSHPSSGSAEKMAAKPKTATPPANRRAGPPNDRPSSAGTSKSPPPAAPTPRLPPSESTAEEIFPTDGMGEEVPGGRHTLETVSDQLTEARDREDIAAVLTDYLGQEFDRGALFLLRGPTAMGWRAMARGKAVCDFEQLEIPLEEASALKTVAENKSYYLGPLQRTPYNSLMLQAFDGLVPAAALLVPLILMGRVIGILYADGNNANLGERLFDLQKLTAKAAMAFEILILKNKILMM